MIRKLTLGSYGKFNGAAFSLAPVTLVLGENESGKTTLFDALFEKLCSPKGTTVHGRRLRERCGERRTATIEFDGEEISFDPDEFLNLFAISSSDLGVDLAPGRPWLERVKSRLLSGGVDPNHLAELLDREARTSGNYAHVRKARELEDRRAATEEDLYEMRQARDALLSREREVRESGKSLEGIDGEIDRKQSRVRHLEHVREQEHLRSERRSLLDTLATLERLEKANQREEELKAFRTDESGDLGRLRGAVDDAERSLAAAQERKHAAVAAFALPVVFPHLPTVAKLVIGALLFAVITLLAVVLCAWRGGVAQSALVSIRDEWLRRLPVAPPLRSESVDGLIAELAAREGGVAEVGMRLAEARTELDDAGEEVNAGREAYETAEAELTRTRSSLSSWFAERGVATGEAYASGLADHSSAARTVEAERERVGEAMERLRASDAAELRAECHVRMARIDQAVTAERLDAEELRGAERELGALKDEIAGLRGK